MKPSRFIVLFLLSFCVASYSICIYIRKGYARNELYYIEGKDSLKDILLKEIEEKSLIEDMRIFFHKRPDLKVPEKVKKKYNFNPFEYARVDSLNIDNRIYKFNCAFDRNKLYIELYKWHYPLEYKHYHLYDGRGNIYEDVCAARHFEKNFLSKLGRVHKDKIDSWLYIYSEFFLWNQLTIYKILFILWIIAKLLELILLKK